MTEECRTRGGHVVSHSVVGRLECMWEHEAVNSF